MSTSTASTLNQLDLKPIGELLNEQFWVPSYQRGYRWKARQVEDLLNDLWEFTRREVQGAIYCLQPVVVRPQAGQWELIDGQQRLTTIHLLLTYIRQQALPSADPSFTLEYATRPGSQEFLTHIQPERAAENIDFYHIVAAYQAITEWFKGHTQKALVAIKLYATLLEKTSVIWYAVPATQDPHDIFIRLNSGKIPLTNAELVKALFLKQSITGPEATEFRRRQLEIAGEWDHMEAELRRNELWYFLNREPNPQPTRIEFVLNSFLPDPTAANKDEFATFYHYNELLAGKTPDEILDEWQAVKHRFLVFQQWFENWELYHRIGYLLAVGESLQLLIQQAAKLSKSAFDIYLIQRIRGRVACRVEDLYYGNDNELLKNVLLLFNVETLRQNADASQRFPFHHYKGNGDSTRKWSLEHIHAQQERRAKSPDKLRAWLEATRPFVVEAAGLPVPTRPKSRGSSPQVNPKQVLRQLNQTLAAPELTEELFDAVQTQIFALFGDPQLHDITNLALLTTDDNSTLSNGPFPQKRAMVIMLERSGSFVPIATRNVFLKYYSPLASHLSYWTPTDRDAYLEAIVTTLVEYLPRRLSL